MWEGPLLPLIPQETCRGISQSFIIFAKKPLKNFNTEKCAFFMGNMHRELGKKYLLNLRLFCSRRRLLLTFFRVQREFFSPKPTESPTIELPKRGEFANSFAKKFFCTKLQNARFLSLQKSVEFPLVIALFSPRCKGKYGKRREKGGCCRR